MTGGTAVPIRPEAAMLVGSVFVEAIALYVGYGALERAVGSTVLERLSVA